MAEPVSQVTDLSLAAADSPITIERDTADTTGRDPVKISPLANDTGDHLTLDPFASDPHATFPQDGFITVKGSTVTYTPGAGFQGTDTFQYSVHDHAGNSDYGIISVNVADNPLPSGAVAPDAVADHFTVDSSKAMKLDVLHNDVSGDGSKLLITGSNEPAHGTVDLKGNQFTYQPDSNFTGHDSFFYKIFSASGLSDVAQVSLDVQQGGGSGGQTLSVHNDSFKVQGTTPTDLDVLKNDKPIGDLSVAAVGTAEHGIVSLHDGVVTYTADDGYKGKDSFSYTATDGSGDTGDGMVKVSVNASSGGGGGSDHTVTVHNDSFKIQGTTPTDLDVLKNDKPSGDLSVSAVGDAHHGIVDLHDGVVTYTADDGFKGKDSFTYTATDSNGDTGDATVKVSVKASSGDSALKLSDILSNDHGIAGGNSHGGGGSSSHASVASVSMVSSHVDIDTLVHQANHHVG